MVTVSAQSLADVSFRELEEDAAFLSCGADQRTRFNLEVDTLIIISWFATAIIIPIITGIGSNIITDKLREKTAMIASAGKSQRVLDAKADGLYDDTKQIALQKADITAFRADLDRLLSEYKPTYDLPENCARRAVESLSELLILNGLPRDIAEERSATIVAEIITLLSSGRT